MRTTRLIRSLMMLLTVAAIMLTTACAGNNDNNQGTNEGTAKTQSRNGSVTRPYSVNPMNNGDMRGHRAENTGRQGMRTHQAGTDQQGMNQLQGGSIQQHMMRAQAQQVHTIRLHNRGDKQYVSLNDLGRAIHMRSEWKNGNRVLEIGDTDPQYRITVNSRTAMRAGEEIQIDPAVMINGELALPIRSVEKLFGEEISYEVRGNQFNLHRPTSDGLDMAHPERATTPADKSLNFREDPADPAKAQQSSYTPEGVQEEAAIPVYAIRDINITGLITEARKYLGVPYDFGAAPYPESKRFDCSSYVRYLYGKRGVDLPRTARAQAKLGNYVSRSNLRRGDLMFFYVPGRFSTNTVVGHVGIYIGNYKMIHSSPVPKDGVQITDINKTYWKKTFLKAKRFVK